MKIVKCAICKSPVILWEDFPIEKLHPIITCTNGVHRFTVKGGEGVIHEVGINDVKGINFE